jgi:hypothetical protein
MVYEDPYGSLYLLKRARGKNIGTHYYLWVSLSINALNRKMLRSKIIASTETHGYISHHAPISWTRNRSEGKIIDFSSRKIHGVHLLDRIRNRIKFSFLETTFSAKFNQNYFSSSGSE